MNPQRTPEQRVANLDNATSSSPENSSSLTASSLPRRGFVGLAIGALAAAATYLAVSEKGQAQVSREDYLEGLYHKTRNLLSPTTLEATAGTYYKNLNAEIAQLSDVEKCQLAKALEHPSPGSYLKPIDQIKEWLSTIDKNDFGTREDYVLAVLHNLNPAYTQGLALQLETSPKFLEQITKVDRQDYLGLLNHKVRFLFSGSELSGADKIHFTNLDKEISQLSKDEIKGIRDFLSQPLPGSNKTGLSSVETWLQRTQADGGDRQEIVKQVLTTLGCMPNSGTRVQNGGSPYPPQGKY